MFAAELLQTSLFLLSRYSNFGFTERTCLPWLEDSTGLLRRVIDGHSLNMFEFDHI